MAELGRANGRAASPWAINSVLGHMSTWWAAGGAVASRVNAGGTAERAAPAGTSTTGEHAPVPGREENRGTFEKVGRIAPYRTRRPVRTLNRMGDTESFPTGRDHPDDDLQALAEGATAPPPPKPPDCPDCGLRQDRRPTLYQGHWVLLEPGIAVPAHHLPPRRRWVIGVDGIAINTWDAEPVPGALSRVAHHLVCPFPTVAPLWPWPRGMEMRAENNRRSSWLFDLPGPETCPMQDEV
ncbi:DUF6083 domain-containing protein [Streptomyces sp. NPDC047987]|uniref:DUF6083 domain-containing protein n=1 Tax=unclassified Streptomyces TaxID=2593676 RepID=UPI00341FA700